MELGDYLISKKEGNYIRMSRGGRGLGGRPPIPSSVLFVKVWKMRTPPKKNRSAGYREIRLPLHCHDVDSEPAAGLLASRSVDRTRAGSGAENANSSKKDCSVAIWHGLRVVLLKNIITAMIYS